MATAVQDSWPQDRYTASPVWDQDFPDLSGLAPFNRSHLVAVRDSKDTSPDARLLLVSKKDGQVSPLPVDWSQTGTARDLEAIASRPGQSGQYLAVEGSSFQDKKARLFELSVTAQGGEAQASHTLPDFGQEIEGLVALPKPEGGQTLLFAGRGGQGEPGRIYWGELQPTGLRFSPEGLQGQAVQAPALGEGQRDLADLVLDQDGRLWGTATIDHGDEGPFSSALYEVGQVRPQDSVPFQIQPGAAYRLGAIKAEALAMERNGQAFLGSDNEAAGGRFESLVV